MTKSLSKKKVVIRLCILKMYRYTLLLCNKLESRQIDQIVYQFLRCNNGVLQFGNPKTKMF